MRQVTVALPDATERIYIDSKIGETMLRAASRLYDRSIILVDSNVHRLYESELLRISRNLQHCAGIVPVEVDARVKDYRCVGTMIRRLHTHALSRASCVVVVGGGSLSDIAGFTSSIYMRGIDFIQVPTTLMAMSDAIIGKVAVNYRGKKNLVGSFYSPRFVFFALQIFSTACRMPRSCQLSSKFGNIT